MNDEEKLSLFTATLSIVAAFWIAMASFFKSFFNRVGAAFDALGSMLNSFGNFLIQFGKIIMLGSVTIGVACFAIYLTVEFMKLVKNGTALMDRFQAKSKKLLDQIKEQQQALEIRVHVSVREMQEALDKALAEPEIVPDAPKTATTQVEAAKPAEAQQEQLKDPSQEPAALEAMVANRL